MSKTLRAISLAGVALAVAVVALFAARPEAVQSTPASAEWTPLGIMQLMRDAKDLPTEQFDAF